ncbi:hypothetical protein GOODEAATRI_034003 [Goodea atripinnis]|uniref:Recombination activating protein 2 n=1 Tax=Goodea atripinnis TaxID=208336 RepID=A0ABV0Q3A7_9TELE
MPGPFCGPSPVLLEAGWKQDLQKVKTDSLQPLCTETLFIDQSSNVFLFLGSETHTVNETERRNGAAGSSGGPRNLLLFDLSGSTEGSGDYLLWTQLLYELY